MAAMNSNPERIEGPTPSGGAYAMVYRHDDGRIEILEFDDRDREIRRTLSRANK
jgi:hypothetical protein